MPTNGPTCPRSPALYEATLGVAQRRERSIIERHSQAPPSALLTSLAAEAYRCRWPAGGDLRTILAGIVASMPDHVERRSGQLWVPNPTCDEENYADRYVGDASKEHALENWLRAVANDLDTLDRSAGWDVLAKSIDQAFGVGLGRRVARRIGVDASQARADRRLGSTATGLLTTTTSRPHRPHTNFGQSS